MFSDNTLTPKEAIRLCALGTLTLEPMTYAALATSVRDFVSHVVGPSPEVMGHSIELLKYEGLVESAEDRDDAPLTVTEAGRAETRLLLTANVRPAATELNKLIVALKFRFLHLLEPADQYGQADLLVEACEQELARLDDLLQRRSGEQSHLITWLEHDIRMLGSRLDWLTLFRDRLAPPP